MGPASRRGLNVSRTPTIEWQVAGACNYDCSYCIQSKKYRRGRPKPDQVEAALEFFAALPGSWEVKCSGGEAFAHDLFLDAIVPGLMWRTTHTISVLTNFSATRAQLMRFARLTEDRLRVFSASVHLEFVDPEAFVSKATWFLDLLGPDVSFVVNQVVRPGRLAEARDMRDRLEEQGIRWFPQLLKQKGGVVDYADEQQALRELIGEAPGPRQANLAPSYRGRSCWAGTEYFTIDKNGGAWSCRTAKRGGEGFMGSIYDGSVQLYQGPKACAYDVCPCTVPANRGMIEGVGPAALARVDE